MPMGLKSGDKTNVTSVETALTAAIDALDPSDRSQLGTRALLMKFRGQLREILKHERTQ
jgi:hypothetical protein